MIDLDARSAGQVFISPKSVRCTSKISVVRVITLFVGIEAHEDIKLGADILSHGIRNCQM